MTSETARVRAKTPPPAKAPSRAPVRGRSGAASRPIAREEPQDVSLTEQAYRTLEEMITTLVLPPGTVLGEQSLARRLQIGRTPIREALQRLARDGLIVVLPRRGILVSEINVRTHLRLIETRRVLERLIARLAAERATAEERATFNEIAKNMRAAATRSDDIAFMRLDHRFNELVASASRNEFAVRSLNTMSALSRRFWYQHYKEAADLPLAATLHAELAETIANRHPAKAAVASDRLIDYIEAFARKTIDI